MRNFIRLCLGFPLGLSVLTAAAAFLSSLIKPILAWLETGQLNLGEIHWLDGLALTAALVPLLSIIIAAAVLAGGLWQKKKSLRWYAGLNAKDAKRFHEGA